MSLEKLKLEERKLNLELKKIEIEKEQSGALANSAFFPKELQGDIYSAVIIFDLSKRMNISVMEVAQSIYIIYNKPSFSTQFIVARLNQSGLIKGSLKTYISEDKQSCHCSAIDAITGEENIGMEITIDIAKKEGWMSKKGSKWQTMPELMLRKRSQSFFIKEFYPQVLFGMQTQEELMDIVDTEILPTQPQKQIKDKKKAPLNMELDDVIDDNIGNSTKKDVTQDDIGLLYTNSEDKQELMRPLMVGRKQLDQIGLNALYEKMKKL